MRRGLGRLGRHGTYRSRIVPSAKETAVGTRRRFLNPVTPSVAKVEGGDDAGVRKNLAVRLAEWRRAAGQQRAEVENEHQCALCHCQFRRPEPLHKKAPRSSGSSDQLLAVLLRYRHGYPGSKLGRAARSALPLTRPLDHLVEQRAAAPKQNGRRVTPTAGLLRRTVGDAHHVPR